MSFGIGGGNEVSIWLFSVAGDLCFYLFAGIDYVMFFFFRAEAGGSDRAGSIFAHFFGGEMFLFEIPALLFRYRFCLLERRLDFGFHRTDGLGDETVAVKTQVWIAADRKNQCWHIFCQQYSSS